MAQRFRSLLLPPKSNDALPFDTNAVMRLTLSVPYEDRDAGHRGKWYAVRRGRQIGVFSSWAQCEPLVRGFQRAEYKSFWTLPEARAYVLEGKAAAMNVQLKHCRMQTSSFVGGKALRA